MIFAARSSALRKVHPKIPFLANLPALFFMNRVLVRSWGSQRHSRSPVTGMVFAAAVGAGLLFRKSPEKEQPVAKNTTTQPEQKPSNLAPLPKPNAGESPNQPVVNSTPQPNPPRVSPGSPANARVGFQIGNLAPEIEGMDLDGQFFKLSDYRGKVVLLDYWAHW